MAVLKWVPWSSGAASYVWRWPTSTHYRQRLGPTWQRSVITTRRSSPEIPSSGSTGRPTRFGRVAEVFCEGRDTVLRNYPCFSIDARFDGGMSGGPVFSETGELSGLVA